MEIDKSKLVKRVEKPGQRFLMHHGEAFRFEELPVGSRIIYPPPALPAIEDADAAIAEALENPLGQDPLSHQLRPGMKVTIAFDDISLPLPQMKRPDLRQRIIEAVLRTLREKGVEDVHLVAALGLHRRMTPSELKHAVGKKVFNEFHPDRLYNFDAEDEEDLVVLGMTEKGEEVETSNRVAESDLLIYVNINLSSMDGGHKSISTGLVSYKTIRHNHNVHTLMRCESYMDPTRSALHNSVKGMGEVVSKSLNVFKIETALTSNTFPSILAHLQKQESDWNAIDKVTFEVNRRALDISPFYLRWQIFQNLRSPYGLLDVAAGDTDLVHEKILTSLFKQQAVPVEGQADVVVMGLPYLCPYNVNSLLNPLLIHTLAVGYSFNMYRGKPLVRRGGVLVISHPLEERFNSLHHPSYIDFYNNVLPETRDAAEIEKRFEASYASDERYRKLYRESYAYHGVHPLYMWYWACYGQEYLGRVIVAGAKDKSVAERLGYETAPDVATALEMAKDTVGPSPEVSLYHYPPIFLCDVT